MKYNVLISAWLSSFRLKTLSLAISTILIGNALACWQNHFNLLIFILTLFTATLLQILSNLANDYGDTIKGSDSVRIGPKRGIHQGLITPKQLQKALIINVILCAFFGTSLLIIACQNQLSFIVLSLIGITSIIAAITYTIGRKPYGYIGLGDVSVLTFFGLVSVIGSYYLQTNQFEFFLIFPSLATGLLSVAVLNINNLRDYCSDKKNNKKTLVVLIGFNRGKHYHVCLLAIALTLFSLFSLLYLQSYWGWLFLLVLPFTFRFIIKIHRATINSEDITSLLLPMIKIVVLTNLLYSIGIILS